MLARYITENNLIWREDGWKRIFEWSCPRSYGLLFQRMCQPLRLTWDIITYRFARSIVTNVYKIFEYIYHFPFHVSLDVQTTQMFCCSHHAVTTTTTIEDEER